MGQKIIPTLTLYNLSLINKYMMFVCHVYLPDDTLLLTSKPMILLLNGCIIVASIVYYWSIINRSAHIILGMASSMPTSSDYVDFLFNFGSLKCP